MTPTYKPSFLLLLLLGWNIIAQPIPDTTPVTKKAKVNSLASPRQQEIQKLSGVSMRKPFVQPNIHRNLTWTASTTQNVSYEVWQATDLTKPFVLLAVTSQTVFPLPTTTAYYRVRAVDTNTLAVSDWAKTPPVSDHVIYQP